MRDDRERLLDIQEAIERIERYAAPGREVFDGDELIQTWVVHHLQIIGEAVRGLSEDLRAKHPQVGWSSIVGMRNVLVHHYFGIEADAVWNVMIRDLPRLKRHIIVILKELGDPG